MALYIARHGQTDWNRQRRYQSRSDVPLNATGKGQALALAKLLNERNVTFARVWSSPLQRAMETARILTRDRVLTRARVLARDGAAAPEIIVEPDFVEISLGQFEGQFTEDLIAQFGDVFHRWQRSAFIDAAPDGESMQQAIERVTPPLAAIREMSIDADVLIVAHQGANMAIKSALEGVLSADRLSAHRQSNDEIDIWDEASGRVIERLSVADVSDNRGP